MTRDPKSRQVGMLPVIFNLRISWALLPLLLALACQSPPAASNATSPKPATAKVPWSFLPLRELSAPKVRNTQWPQQRADFFLLAAMEKKNLNPAPPTDPRTLIRRLSFDLTGLPPTPEEVEAFVKACSSASQPHSPSPIPHSVIGAAVDRLLSSPHYGERWARYWLDLARYVDQTGSWLEPTGEKKRVACEGAIRSTGRLLRERGALFRDWKPTQASVAVIGDGGFAQPGPMLLKHNIHFDTLERREQIREKLQDYRFAILCAGTYTDDMLKALRNFPPVQPSRWRQFSKSKSRSAAVILKKHKPRAF